MPLEVVGYPEFRRDEQCFQCAHGDQVPDPYRWLEDPDSEETKQFVEAQNKITLPLLEKWELKDKAEKRLTELTNYSRYGCPRNEGSKYYYNYNPGLLNQPVMYCTDGLNDENARVFIDPNKFSEDGTSSMSTYTFSEDGSLFAYGVSEGGSDWFTAYILDVKSGQLLPDKLERIKFSGLRFSKDNSGLFYSRYPEDGSEASGRSTAANTFHTCYYHVIGRSQQDDVTIASFPGHPQWMGGVVTSRNDGGRHLLLSVNEGCDSKELLWHCDLGKFGGKITETVPSQNWTKLVNKFEAEYSYVHNWGSVFYFHTNKDAPMWKLIKVDIGEGKFEPEDVIPETENKLASVNVAAEGSLLVLVYSVHCVDTLVIHSAQDGKLVKQIEIGISEVSQMATKHDSYELFYRLDTFVSPGTIYRVDLRDPAFTPVLWREMKLKNINQDDFVSKQVFYPSKDGTKIPMFIVHKKDLDFSKKPPVSLYGYGGFNIALPISCSTSTVLWMQHMEGVYCQPGLRGGSEYGEAWHQAGMTLQRQNVFDDFIHAALYITQSGISSPDRIRIQGGSNGGLLVAACMLQRPDLFAVVECHVGVLDMLRFHKFTIGHAWQSDYGYPDDNEEHFKCLKQYSPYHNVRMPASGQLPAFIAFTADHDDRVSPLHSLKFVAQLQHLANQHKDRQTNPLLILLDTRSGHGAGKPTAKLITERVHALSFAAQHMALHWAD